jgi:predicted DNA-binding protein (MmcQ/YjbR family)
MILEDLRSLLLSKPGAMEDLPFGPDTLVLKVGGKMFALVGLNSQPLRVSLKCDPIDAQYLRDTYPAVQPGYHLNKRHWNTVTLDGSVPEGEFLALVEQSHRLVVKGLSRAERQKLQP